VDSTFLGHHPCQAAEQLAGADPAGVRKTGEALPAKMRENGAAVARAAGRLPLASSGSHGDAPRCCAKLEAVSRRRPPERRSGYEWSCPSRMKGGQRNRALRRGSIVILC
jgi:hypothetical protein